MVDDALRRERELKDAIKADLQQRAEEQAQLAHTTLQELEAERDALAAQLNQTTESLRLASQLSEKVPHLQAQIVQAQEGQKAAVQEADRALAEREQLLEANRAAGERVQHGEEELARVQRQVQQETKAQEQKTRQRRDSQLVLDKQLAEAQDAGQEARAQADRERERANEAEGALRQAEEQALKVRQASRGRANGPQSWGGVRGDGPHEGGWAP